MAHASVISRREAIRRARTACERVSALGIDIRVAGSLATGAFAAGSDIDFVVLDCPRELKYAIEGIVEDSLGGHPFDVIYFEEASSRHSERLLREALDAQELR